MEDQEAKKIYTMSYNVAEIRILSLCINTLLDQHSNSLRLLPNIWRNQIPHNFNIFVSSFIQLPIKPSKQNCQSYCDLSIRQVDAYAMSCPFTKRDHVVLQRLGVIRDRRLGVAKPAIGDEGKRDRVYNRVVVHMPRMEGDMCAGR